MKQKLISQKENTLISGRLLDQNKTTVAINLFFSVREEWEAELATGVELGAHAALAGAVPVQVLVIARSPAGVGHRVAVGRTGCNLENIVAKY